ncbi:RICIN domain-containing protein [Actinoplanes sp. NPDC051343]|uniref:RICIN domain-containing protein n=1 Tax=Actinoplanes sp. NPDC051343 TaxID=3363906 RepID=UPI0037977EA0
MTAVTKKLRHFGWKLSASSRKRYGIAAAVVFILGAGALSIISEGPFAVGAEKLTGKDVPLALQQAIITASLSCPTLNPPRLAAQLMMASEFAVGARHGVAGLSDAAWTRWRPKSDANRNDGAANVLALAHQTCDVVGQLRAATLTGDMWPLALAVTKSGISAVVRAKRVPASAQSYVEKAEAYANWYADQPPFRLGKPTTPPSPTASGGTPVPDADVAAVRKAGQVCPAITGPQVAAQLMALSKFDPNLRSSDGRQGIALFPPDLWKQYRVSKTASVWDPNDAVPALGMAMCDLVAQLHELNGADPYRLALAAYQWGESAVRVANGAPRANVPQLADTTASYVPLYEKDSRIGGAAPAPPSAASSSVSRAVTATPSSGSSSSALPPAGPSHVAPPITIGGFQVGVNYHLLNDWTREVAELPDLDASRTAGTHVQLWANGDQQDQYWRLTAAPEPGYAVFVNAFSGLAMGVEAGGTWNGAKVLQVTVNPADRFQQWSIENAGGGQVRLRNHATGKVLDILGTDVPPTKADGTWDGHWLEQWDLVSAERDQQWSLVR